MDNEWQQNTEGRCGVKIMIQLNIFVFRVF